DADARLQIAAVTVADTLRLEHAYVGRIVSPSFALRAYRATTQATLDRMRSGEHLDYLVVTGPNGVTLASVDLPRGITRTPQEIVDGSLDGIAAQHTVVIQGSGGARVVGGRLWRPDVPASLAVTTALVVNGRAATTSPHPVTVNGRRVV